IQCAADRNIPVKRNRQRTGEVADVSRVVPAVTGVLDSEAVVLGVVLKAYAVRVSQGDVPLVKRDAEHTHPRSPRFGNRIDFQRGAARQGHVVGVINGYSRRLYSLARAVASNQDIIGAKVASGGYVAASPAGASHIIELTRERIKPVAHYDFVTLTRRSLPSYASV